MICCAFNAFCFLQCSYTNCPAIFPITAPKTGIGISTWPASDAIALTVTSRHTVSQLITKSSLETFPSFSAWIWAAIPKAAVIYADATFAGVAVKFVAT